MNLDRPLSTLELTVLGVVLKRGPCVAHAVVSEFTGSQTFAYRSGAGSIYPLLKRLHKAGILSVEKKKYSITDAGIRALRAWIMPPFEQTDFSTTLDTLRSRAYFLKLLSPAEIQDFTSEAIEGLENLLRDCEETHQAYVRSGDRFSEYAMLGAVKETEARIAWLQEVRREFAGALPSAN